MGQLWAFRSWLAWSFASFVQLEGCQGAKPSRKGWEKEQQLKKQIGWRYIGNTSRAEAPFTVSAVELSKKSGSPRSGGSQKTHQVHCF